MGIASTPGLPPEFANPLEVGTAETLSVAEGGDKQV
jgi:hypothetical protein